MSVGKSWRTPAKHELMNKFIGEESGAVGRISSVSELLWLDLTAGDGVCEEDAEWRRSCSPGILAYHAVQCPKPVAVVLHELQPAAYDRLLVNLARELPAMGYVQRGPAEWIHTTGAHITAINGSGMDASIDRVGPQTAVVVLNDPNAITEWALRNTMMEEITKRGAWCCRSMSTLGCNVSGIKRLDRIVRDEWFDLIDSQQAALPHYRDLLLSAIERDSAQWAYLFSTASKDGWKDRLENVCRKAFSKYGRTVELVWQRSDPDEFEAAKQRLFLTKDERGEAA